MKSITITLICSLLIAACGGVSDSGSVGLSDTSDTWFKPASTSSWRLQLQGSVNLGHDVELYAIDLFDSPVSLINDLHAPGRHVIGYFSAGSYEDWRDDASDFEPADLGKPLAGWPGENWLDVRSLNVRNIMTA
jgi:hypothetical protein